VFVSSGDRNLWERARRLRAEGWSLRRIARHLDVSLSSASVWTRGAAPSTPVEPASVATPKRLPDAVRWCSRCSSFQPESAFNRLRNGFQAWCRACFKRYYEDDRARHRARNDALKARRISEAQAYVLQHLRANPCVDCGEREPIVLEFDHVGTKRSEISTLVRRGVRLRVLTRELAVCEVVCANCHRRRTAMRAGWRRADADLRSGAPWGTKEHERNVRWAIAVLAESGCADCGETDACVLDFDHVGEKTGGVMRLARSGVGLRRLQEEIARCEVRCVNCHRRRTAISKAYYRATVGGAEVPPARVELALPD
jgi:hypothetical protein